MPQWPVIARKRGATHRYPSRAVLSHLAISRRTMRRLGPTHTLTLPVLPSINIKLTIYRAHTTYLPPSITTIPLLLQRGSKNGHGCLGSWNLSGEGGMAFILYIYFSITILETTAPKNLPGENPHLAKI